VLAGFVEVGESLEGCVRREIHEEVGVDVRDIAYLGSQAWPFPRSLMLAFEAVADPEAPLAPADGEIAEAMWVTRADLRGALRAGDWGVSEAPLLLPGKVSIARSMLESWAAAE
jgi:NAD+ diphosphatase